MKASIVVALTCTAGLLMACSDDANGTGQGGYTPGVIANVAVSSGTSTKSSAQSSSGETSAESSTTASSSASSSNSSSNSSTAAGLLSEPLFPYCGCISDNLGSPGLCQACWNEAVDPKKGSCANLIAGCGSACTDMLDALPVECGMSATPGCLENIAQMAPNNVDDFAAVLDCICNCQACDDEACM